MLRLLLCGHVVSWSRETIPAFILIDNFLLFEYQDKKVDTSLVNVSFCEALSEAGSPTAILELCKTRFWIKLGILLLDLLILIVIF